MLGMHRLPDVLYIRPPLPSALRNCVMVTDMRNLHVPVNDTISSQDIATAGGFILGERFYRFIFAL